MPVPRITKEELKARLDSGAAPVLVDARLKYPYEHSTVKLPGSVRFGHGAPAHSFPRDREVVVYDSDSGRFKRGWGAYGIPLGEIANLVEHAEPEVASAGTVAPYAPGAEPEKWTN